MSPIRKIGAALFATAALSACVAGPVAAANNSQQNGLVNVSVGDVEVLNNADIGVAAAVAATVCGVKVGPVAVLATAVDRSGATSTVCTAGTDPVTITQA